MRLTDQFVREAECPPGMKEIVYWDDRRRGLGLRVRISGTKTYIIYYRHKAKQYKISLGRPPEMSIRQAYQAYTEVIVKLGKDENPHDEKKPEDTVRDLVYAYLERHARMLKTYGMQKWRLERWILPRWGKNPVSSIRRLDVDQLHKEIGQKGPIEANRVLALLHSMFHFAQKWEILKAGHENPAAHIEKFPEKKRMVWVAPEDMEKLNRALEPESIFIRAAILLYLVTGLRNRELVRRKWDDVDWNRKIMILADTKPDRPFLLPLSDVALEILKGIPRLYGNPYIFPGGRNGQPWTQFPRKAFDRIRKRAGLNITVHDLRRTYGSWLASSGVSLKIIAGLLNQTSQSVTDSVYAQLANDPLREASSIVGEKIQQIVKMEGKE